MSSLPQPRPVGDAYLRKSPGSSTSKTEASLERQLDDIKARMAEDGVTLGKVWTDVHPRWELWERPDLSALRERVKRRETDFVYAWDTSRLATGVLHQAILIEEGLRFGVPWRFCEEEVDAETPLGQLTWLIRGTFNQVELERIRDRTQGGKRQQLEKGQLLFYHKGRKAPLYGYRWADDTRTRLVPHEPEAAVVRRCFRDAAAGVTLGELALRLTQEGVPPPGRSRVWQTSTLGEYLHHPAYKGDPAVNRTERFRADGRWKRRRRPEADWHRLPEGSVPALVDAALWERVQAVLLRNRTQAPRGMAVDRQTEFLLRGGLTRCAHCGGALNALTVPRKRDYAPEKVIYRTYACPSLNRQRAVRAAGLVAGVAGDASPSCPRPVRVRAEALDLAVWRMVLEALLTPPPATPAEQAEARRKVEREHAAAVRRVREAERVMDATAAELVTAPTEEEKAPLRRLQETQGASLRAARLAVDAATRELAGVKEREEAMLALFRAATTSAVELEGLIPGRLTPVEYGTVRGLLGAAGVRVTVWHKDAEEGPPARPAGRYVVEPYEPVLWRVADGSSCRPGGSTPPTPPDPRALLTLLRRLAAA